MWEREDGLASVLAVDFVDLPVTRSDASVEEEFATASSQLFFFSSDSMIVNLHLLNSS